MLVTPRRYFEQPSALRRLLLETDLSLLFDKRFAIERGVYRRHRLFGSLTVVGAAATLALAWFFFRNPKAAGWLSAMLGRFGFRVLVVVAAAIGVVILVFGVCLIVRPSVLKGVEAAANRWIQPLPPRSPGAGISRLVLRWPRLVGLVLLLAGLACLRPL